jgi:hypothetical protein
VTRKRMVVLGAGAAALALIYAVWASQMCRSAQRRFGIEVPRCPSGKPRQQLAIRGEGLRRDGPGDVVVTATAHYTVGDSASVLTAPVHDLEADLSLVDPAGKETPVRPVERWMDGGHVLRGTITLPPGPDGDYLLRARVETPIGTDTVELPLPLYAPARIHVLTDRPLYRPGDSVSFRALALRASDLSPIDHRPGRWIVRSPDGQVLLEEKAPVGEWGVVAGDFPLDQGAATGDWQVVWRSGADEGTRTFRVEPFTLPRFRVETVPDRPFHRGGDTPMVRGSVTYSSGAPVSGAALQIDWSIESDGAGWPAPTSWTQGGLPQRAIATAGGRFELRLPEVPPDLQGQVTLVARITATDSAGDRVAATATVLLSADAILADAITELDGGLVAGFNNRVYLRVTTADGQPLPGASIRVERAWAGAGPAIDAVLDEDAVARIQLDPGPPVNVVVPAPPVRPPPAPPVVTRTRATDGVTGQPLLLPDLMAIDGWQDAIARCAKWADTDTVELGLQVDARGAIVASDASASDLGACVLSAIRTRRLGAGAPRLLSLSYRIDGRALPTVTAEAQVPVGGPVEVATMIGPALRDARDCIPADVTGAVPWTLSWQIEKGSRQLRTSWNATAAAMPAALRTCLERSVARHALAAPADQGRIGLFRFAVDRPDDPAKVAPPQPTILQGYELRVVASRDGAALGSTLVRLEPGTVPPLRLRATPVLPRPGDTVTIDLVRGPDYVGEVPKVLYVEHLGKATEVEVSDKRSATFTLPKDARGWYQLRAADARALVYVRSGEELAVSVTPDRPAYAPGAQARLAVQTAVGGRGAPAAVGLFGVDQSLGQLALLPGADDLGSLRPPIEMEAPAFGVLEAQALTLGRIRGDAAAEATVLGVASVPAPADLDAAVSASAETTIDPIAELTDRFYRVLAELHAQVRVWERTAPPGEMMTPERMAALWGKALDAAGKGGAPVVDAFGRRMQLHLLPPPLLALVDPRQVVAVGTRLPEDVENWSAWVARRKP